MLIKAKLNALVTTLVVVLAFLALSTGGAAHAQNLGGAGDSAQHRDGVSLTQELFRPWKSRYEKLTKTAASAMQSRKPDNYAGQLHLLEVELVHLMKLAAADKSMTPDQRALATNEARALLSQVQWNYPSLQAQMRQHFEASNPGKSGAQLVTRKLNKNGSSVDVFAPSFHSQKKLPDAVRNKRSAELIAKHKAAHPGEAIHEPLNKNTVKKVGSGELLEWVVVPTGKKGHPGDLRVTRNAKHVVTSGGKDTLAAGSIKIIWHPEHPGVPAKALAVLVSNWSGTFQPDMASLESTMNARLASLGFPRDRFVLTTTMPLEPKIYETFLEMRKPKSKVAASLKRLALRAKQQTASATARWNRTLGKPAPKASMSKKAAKPTLRVVKQQSGSAASQLRRKRAGKAGSGTVSRAQPRHGAKKAIRRVRAR